MCLSLRLRCGIVAFQSASIDPGLLMVLKTVLKFSVQSMLSTGQGLRQRQSSYQRLSAQS
jgi:hypothetical protein